MQAYGATAANMIALACLAVQAGTAEVVACVFADAPLREGRPAGSEYGSPREVPATRAMAGWPGMLGAVGLYGANPLYALAARRHMEAYGTTTEHFGHIAVAQREWAALNPVAQMRTPITLDDHRAARWIAEPFRLLDCSLVSNGGAALIVTSAARAADLRQPAVPVLGWAQCHPGYAGRRDDAFGLVSGAARSGPAALAMAGITLEDVDVVELYDCYTYTVLVTLEDYGFCAKGEGGPFVASGVLGTQGTLKLNTGGGQLSGFYLWGMTPLVEAVIQARGQGGDRQVDKHEVVLVSGNGGILDHHSTLVLSGGVS
jgi:acetyl-CoA acetyltransferase